MNSKQAAVTRHRRMGFAMLVLVVAACRPGLASGDWLWCKQNLAAVDAAADSQEIAKSPISYQEPSWLPDYVTSIQNRNSALMAANVGFTTSCDAAAAAADVGDSHLQWCMTDGIGQVWDASISLGYMVDQQAETFAYKAVPLQKRIDNPEFVAACRAAVAG